MNYKNGKFHGRERQYYKIGNLKTENLLENGMPIGIGKYYNENGKFHSEANYMNGKFEGSYKQYDKNGNLQIENFYKNNGLLIEKSFYENGQLRN